MSRPRRRSPSKRGNQNNQNNQNNHGNQGNQNKQGGRGQARDFWAGELPAEDAQVSIPDDPTAVVRSLGPPPLGGRDTAAVYYFAAIYEKAAGIASALAAANGVLARDRD